MRHVRNDLNFLPVPSDPGTLIRQVRLRHNISQETLARRTGTAQRQISRIERGKVSPSTATLSRLLAAVGERLELQAIPGPRDNSSDVELRADFEQLTPSERLSQAASLSHTLTKIAAGRQ